MDQFNSKLYDKYNNLKKRRRIEEAELGHDREAKIKAYQNDVEGLAEALKSENDLLRSEIAALKVKCEESQKLMLEESQKTKELSNEVGRLQSLLLQKDNDNSVLPRTPDASPRVGSRNTPKGSSKKKTPNSRSRRSKVQYEEAFLIPYESCQQEQHVPDCCRNNISSSEGAMGKGEVTCAFQTLMEFLVSMKFSLNLQTEGLCLLAIHQRSGYTFTLTWMRRENGGDGELMYRVSTLGTLERVALDWMKEEMIFSTTMFSAFFEKIKRVLGRS